jgi:uridylate kinase
MPKSKRILLKLSGEALAGESAFGIDGARVAEIASEISEARQLGVEFGIVLGGGNFFRGVNSGANGLQRVTVDYMGMIATVMNALALRDILAAQSVPAEVFSAIPMEPAAPRFDRLKALAALAAGHVAIFAGGTGNPYFTTDTAAALRAVEIGAVLLAKATKVDGVYDKDPVRFADARRYEKISYGDVLAGGLAVMDATAVSLCKDNHLPVFVFNLNVRGNILKLVRGDESIGTIIS